MIIKTQAFVLKKYNFRETSLIVHLYTNQCGKLKGICKGVRQLKSRQSSHFELPTLLDVEVYDKPSRELQLISETSIVNYFPGIKNHLEIYLRAVYALELVDNFTQIHMRSEVLFKLLHAYLAGLNPQNQERFSLAFMVKLLKTLGIFPNLLECHVCRTRIDHEAYFCFQQGSVTCGQAVCKSRFQWNQELSVNEISFIYDLIRETFAEIDERTDETMLVKIQNTIESYIHYITNLKLKSPKVIREIFGAGSVLNQRN